MTYSIVARDPLTGQFGVAVQTHQVAVGRIVSWAEPGYGALATQSLSNPAFGPLGMAMLRQGMEAEQVLAALVAGDLGHARRQVALVDRKGNAAAYTGEGCIAHAGHYIGAGYSVQANMMTRPTVIDAMRHAYENSLGNLAERMVAALRAAQAEDGDIRGQQSAALLVVSSDSEAPTWKTDYDLRVDEHPQPVEELARLVTIRHAQRIDAEGFVLFDEGKLSEALAKWAEARKLAPDQEELSFWQAVALADGYPDQVAQAAAIFRAGLDGHERRAHWLELLDRLAACGLIERPQASTELKQALEQS